MGLAEPYKDNKTPAPKPQEGASQGVCVSVQTEGLEWNAACRTMVSPAFAGTMAGEGVFWGISCKYDLRPLILWKFPNGHNNYQPLYFTHFGSRFLLPWVDYCIIEHLERCFGDSGKTKHVISCITTLRTHLLTNVEQYAPTPTVTLCVSWS